MQSFDVILNIGFILLAFFILLILQNKFSFLKTKSILGTIFCVLIYFTIAFLFTFLLNIHFIVLGGFSGEWLEKNIITIYVFCVFSYILALIYYEFKYMLRKEKPIVKSLLNISCLSIVFLVGLLCALLIDIYVFGN